MCPHIPPCPPAAHLEIYDIIDAVRGMGPSNAGAPAVVSHAGHQQAAIPGQHPGPGPALHASLCPAGIRDQGVWEFCKGRSRSAPKCLYGCSAWQGDLMVLDAKAGLQSHKLEGLHMLC